eukprot:jgi/Mesvir1/397/Mv11288-RA.1
MGDSDTVLFNLQNNFYLGAFQAAINEGASLTNLGEAREIIRDCYVYRSYIAQGSYELVLAEISKAAAPALQAVRLLATYLSSPDKKELVMKTLSDWLSDASTAVNPTVLLVTGIIHCHEGNYPDALKYLQSSSDLEMMSLSVQVYLAMDRPDAAERQLKAMHGIDEDATLTQLATAWVNMALGGPKVQEAFYIFQELGEKYTWTLSLINGSAVASLRMGRVDDAEKELLEALNKDSKHADTLANLIVASLHLGKPSTRYLNQLKVCGPNHAFVKRLKAMDEAFDRSAQAFGAVASA